MRAVSRKGLCAAVCLLLISAVIASAAEVKFDKVEYMPPKVEGQKKTPKR
jgi:hypothetical protein